ncbi:MAG TPA: hypothetical protein VHW00_21655 [Thermoanaerobaculia bacterium]|nr:hypothetical protein [Thermoanaerobaculia bacterium]
MKNGIVALLLFSLQLGDLRRSVPVSERPLAETPRTPTLVAMKHFPPQTRPRSRAFFRSPAHEDAALIAVTGTRRNNVPVARDFPRLWRRAAPSRRIYIAFARRDLAAAQNVERALARRGYHCFIFLASARNNPAWADSVELGRYYREARTRLVLDSRNARAANGVRLELLAQGRKSCCKRCYFMNGMLAGCDAITCGTQCAKARGA